MAPSSFKLARGLPLVVRRRGRLLKLPGRLVVKVLEGCRLVLWHHKPTGPYSSMHALVIGINVYGSSRLKDLSNAVSDADTIYQYLRTDLRVPEQHIVNLRDTQASYDRIIHELRALRTRVTIRKGDPILIYFAGHGASEQSSSSGEGDRGRISTIIPYNCFLVDGDGNETLPMSSQIIGALLHEVAERPDGCGVGNNITVVFDCCHSGTGTRQSSSQSVRKERGFALSDHESFAIPSHHSDAGDSLRGDRRERAIAVVDGYHHYGSRSHVLFAACREGERAHEDANGGEFTRAFLAALRNVVMDQTTYADLMDHIARIPGQTPQLEGCYTNRLLFRDTVPSVGSIGYPVVKVDGIYTMNAGSAHGIVSGSQYSLYSSRFSDAALGITMSAKKVDLFQTELSCVDGSCTRIPAPLTRFYAFETARDNATALRLHIVEPTDEIHSVLTSPDVCDTVDIRADEREAVISIRESNGRLQYFIFDPLINGNGLYQLHETTGTARQDVLTVVRAAAHFYRYLHHEAEAAPVRAKVSVLVHELHEDVTQAPPRVKACLTGPLRHLDTFEVVADNKTAYGLEVQNASSMPLIVWAFYFDCSDLSIQEYCRPAAWGTDSVPHLLANGSLSIGYGSGEGQPFKYYLRPGQTMDVGFIKFFISSQPIDLGHIEQRSAFCQSSPRASAPIPRVYEATWDTLTIAVVQRQSP